MSKNKQQKVIVAMSPNQSLRDASGQAGGVHKLRVFVAMSGGVDSSVAAFLLKKQGFNVEGVTMKTFCYKDSTGKKQCCGLEGILNAQKTCEILGIPHHIFDVSKKFKKEIIDNFITEYEAGKTPNPCVRCNKLIKFEELLKFVRKQGGDFLATGHYARIQREIQNPKFEIRNKSKIQNSKSKIIYHLLKGIDSKKDQTYFLYNLNQKQLSQILFPLGDYKKEDIKKLAKKHKLKTTEQESQEVCFINTNLYDFLKHRVDFKPGEVIDTDGNMLGKHRGLPFYTIGQRAGVGGKGPYFVVSLNKKKNKLIITNKTDDPALFKNELKIKNANWISGVIKKVNVQIRYNDNLVKAVIKKSGNYYLIKLEKSKRAITPGQSAVFYKGDECLGGGIIV